MKTWKDIVRGALAACLLWAAAGCGRLIYDEYPDGADPDPSSQAYLVLKIASAAPTRVADDKELMHSLRVVLLDKDGKVEYNDYISSSSRPDLFGADGVGRLDYAANYRLIPTTPGEKKIFLIANEEGVSAVQSANASFSGPMSLTEVLDGWKADDPDKTGFEAMVKSIYFNSDYSGNIPLTSSYAFTIDDADLGKRVEKKFFLVYAATKFKFEFENQRSGDVRIDALSLLSLSKGMYLMANFGKTPAEKKTVDSYPGKKDSDIWIDWLKAASDATTANPNDPNNEETNESFGWIKDYELPNGISHVEKYIIGDDSVLPSLASSPKTIPAGKKLTLPVVYFPESKNLIPGNTEDQDYHVSIKLTDMALGTEGNFTGDAALPLTSVAAHNDNLVALFRNTHVKIRCVIPPAAGIEVKLHLHVIPWYPEEPEVWEFTDHVTVDTPMTWTEDTYEKIEGSRTDQNGGNDESGEVVTLKLDGGWLEGTFKIDAPVNGKWYAELIPIGEARPNAMTFVDEKGDPETPNSGDPAVCTKLSGVIFSTDANDKNLVTIRIKPTVLENDQESRFYLKFTVENLGVWIDAPVFGTKNYCTIVRPANRMV